MKTTFTKTGLLLGLATAALLATAAQAGKVIQPPTPIGQWDCVMSGNGQNGIIFLNFTDDHDITTGLPTFEALYIQAGHTKVQAGRDGTTGGTGRNGASTTDSSFTNLYGGGFIFGSAGPVNENGQAGDWMPDSRGRRGNWFYNSKGQTVGSFYTVLNANSRITNFFQTCVDEPLTIPLTNGGSFNILVDFCFTNPVYVTNFPWSAPDGEFGFTNLTFTNGNFTVGSVGLTNNVSFVGKVVPGKRITMVGSSAFGKFTITGVPSAPIQTPSNVAVDGFVWTGTKVENGFRTVEQFGLFPISTDSGFPTTIQNAYLLSGQGPSYTYGSLTDVGGELCLISQKKQIAFSIAEIQVGTGSAVVKVNVRGTAGQFINTKKKIGAVGQGSSTDDPNIIKFDATLSPFPIP